MATYTTLRKGSKGDDVKRLQQTLLDKGYDLGEYGADGSYGNVTQAAVKKYQTDNGLKIDGVAGNETLGSLYGTAKSAASPATAPASAADMTFKYDGYTESDAVTNAQNAVAEHSAAKPGEYVSQYDAEIDAIMDKILGREEFSYDLNADALYQQYKDQYVLGGKLAMMDTMGQAAAMTGGYGNSYASTAGNQAYQAYLQQLNEVVPELYGMARDAYDAEGEEMYQQYALLGDREEQDYGRYMDELNAWLTERDYLEGRYDAERDYDYGRYADDRSFAYGTFADDRSYAYQRERDAVSDKQWHAEYDESQRQYAEQMAYQRERDAIEDSRYDREYEDETTASDAGSSSVEPLNATEWNKVVTTCKEYADDNDEDGLVSYLEGLVDRGYITEEEAYELQIRYFGVDDDLVDTTVKKSPVKKNGIASVTKKAPVITDGSIKPSGSKGSLLYNTLY